jgi:hypothetical protein
MLIRDAGSTGDCSMKKLGFAFALLSTTLLWAAPDKPNPADFPVKVHVVSSGTNVICGSSPVCSFLQVLETVIDGQPVQLEGSGEGVLALDDYPARISPAIHSRSKHPNSYDIYRGYDLLLPDGTTRTYTVTRLGPASSKP